MEKSVEECPFHMHLDQCEQCRDHPFKLCPTGEESLRVAAGKAELELRQILGILKKVAD